MLDSHIPIFDHLTELIDAIIDQLLFVVLRVANYLPEEVCYICFKLVILSIFAKLTQTLELFNGHLFRWNKLNLLKEIVYMLLLEVEG
jgi:hypothetical protein